MTDKDVDILLSPEARQAVRENMHTDPLKVALDKNISDAALVATQVKYLQRCRDKMPSFYDAQCILSPLSFEQASGERVAEHKFGGMSGRLAVDLTCGLGVDAFCLSRRFDKVIAVEKNPLHARIACENFRLLGADNIEVVQSGAEEFISGILAGRISAAPDFIYADPDRRSEGGRKMVVLSDCSPDMGALLPELRRIADSVMIKLSPVFDIDEVVRIFGPGVKAEVISVGGECREMVATVVSAVNATSVVATVLGVGSVGYDPGILHDDITKTTEHDNPGAFDALVVPDPALAKARVAVPYFRAAGAYIENDHSLALFGRPSQIPRPCYGKAYSITEILEYNPSKLKRHLKSSGIRRLNIIRRGFPVPSSEISARLGITEGGAVFAAFVRYGGKLWMLMLEPCAS